ncbi:MAG: ATP-binding protein, partial [Acidobacteriota bacterium]|nr:ATP-binding protein [Acidobacteriota bacterium]
MAQWSLTDKTLYAKVVYYGPAYGGKTTNLESLHRILDPKQKEKLVSVKTADDRTLFFDLLPFDLGNVLGYRVALKVYTVPGQVRYDATRQVVLSGADAVIFVADSSPDREEQNRWSLQNLRLNMRAKGLDPKVVPVLHQFNKQDVEGAISVANLSHRLGLAAESGYPAVAITGQGVLETFVDACTQMLARLVEKAEPKTRKAMETGDMEEHIRRAFAPHTARVEQAGDQTPAPSESPVVVPQDDLLQSSVQASVELGEQLTQESGRATRLEREAEALRLLGELQRSSAVEFSRETLISKTLKTVREVMVCHHVALVVPDDETGTRVVDVVGVESEPFHRSSRGKELMARLVKTGRPAVLDDLTEESAELAEEKPLADIRALLAVPVGDDENHLLVASAKRPDGAFDPTDTRFLATIGAHLAVAIERSELYEQIEAQRDNLEVEVQDRTAELRQACQELKSLDSLKDRFLDNLSHEMKTPLTAMLTSATFLRDYRTNAAQRAEMFRSIVESGETLQTHIDRLFQIATIDRDSERADCETCTVQQLLERAASGMEGDRLQIQTEHPEFPLSLDTAACARAIGNLIDNALKFSPDNGGVEVRTDMGPDQLSIHVCDHGPGIELSQLERLFQPFEQGGEILTEKPDGMGIGLYETRQILKRYGGELTFQPRSGGGSEFSAVLPLER